MDSGRRKRLEEIIPVTAGKDNRKIRISARLPTMEELG